MAGITNKGKYKMLDVYLRNATGPTSFKLVLLDSTSAVPNADTNTMTDPVSLTEIPAGNGYTAGGATIERSNVGWDTLTEDDPNDKALIKAKDVVWTASGGTLPSSGLGARYALLVDNAGDAIAFFDLGSNRIVSDTQTLTIQDAEIDATE